MKIFETIAGSRLYGTARPNSDYDYRAIHIPRAVDLLGFTRRHETVHHTIHDESGDATDQESTALHKFVKLALENNPNILDILFAGDEYVMYLADEWMPFRDARRSFLTQQVRSRYAGYARAQLHRIKNHKKWLENPEPENPSYREWLQNRNADRLQTEIRFGYDVKHAAHLFRLLFQAETILVHGEFNPTLTGKDIEFVRDVLNGKVSYDLALEYADHLFDIVNSTKSDLPKTHSASDMSRFEMMVIDTYRSVLCNG